MEVSSDGINVNDGSTTGINSNSSENTPKKPLGAISINEGRMNNLLLNKSPKSRIAEIQSFLNSELHEYRQMFYLTKEILFRTQPDEDTVRDNNSINKIKSIADSELKAYRQIFSLIATSLSSLLQSEEEKIVLEYGKKYIVSLLQFQIMETSVASTTDTFESLSSQLFPELKLDEESKTLVKDFFTMGVQTAAAEGDFPVRVLRGEVWNTVNYKTIQPGI